MASGSERSAPGEVTGFTEQVPGRSRAIDLGLFPSTRGMVPGLQNVNAEVVISPPTPGSRSGVDRAIHSVTGTGTSAVARTAPGSDERIASVITRQPDNPGASIRPLEPTNGRRAGEPPESLPDPRKVLTDYAAEYGTNSARFDAMIAQANLRLAHTLTTVLSTIDGQVFSTLESEARASYRMHRGIMEGQVKKRSLDPAIPLDAADTADMILDSYMFFELNVEPITGNGEHDRRIAAARAFLRDLDNLGRGIPVVEEKVEEREPPKVEQADSQPDAEPARDETAANAKTIVTLEPQTSDDEAAVVVQPEQTVRKDRSTENVPVYGSQPDLHSSEVATTPVELGNADQEKTVTGSQEQGVKSSLQTETVGEAAVAEIGGRGGDGREGKTAFEEPGDGSPLVSITESVAKRLGEPHTDEAKIREYFEEAYGIKDPPQIVLFGKRKWSPVIGYYRKKKDTLYINAIKGEHQRRSRWFRSKKRNTTTKEFLHLAQHAADAKLHPIREKLEKAGFMALPFVISGINYFLESRLLSAAFFVDGALDLMILPLHRMIDHSRKLSIYPWEFRARKKQKDAQLNDKYKDIITFGSEEDVKEPVDWSRFKPSRIVKSVVHETGRVVKELAMPGVNNPSVEIDESENRERARYLIGVQGPIDPNNPIYGGFHATSIQGFKYLVENGSLHGMNASEAEVRQSQYQQGDVSFFPTHSLQHVAEENNVQLLDPQEAYRLAVGYAKDIAQEHGLLERLGLQIGDAQATEVVNDLLDTHDPSLHRTYLDNLGITQRQVEEAIEAVRPLRGILLAFSADFQTEPDIIFTRGDGPTIGDLNMRLEGNNSFYQYVAGNNPLGEQEEEYLVNLQREYNL